MLFAAVLLTTCLSDVFAFDVTFFTSDNVSFMAMPPPVCFSGVSLPLMFAAVDLLTGNNIFSLVDEFSLNCCNVDVVDEEWAVAEMVVVVVVVVSGGVVVAACGAVVVVVCGNVVVAACGVVVVVVCGNVVVVVCGNVVVDDDGDTDVVVLDNIVLFFEYF